jgi:transcription antitermination protein NusB
MGTPAKVVLNEAIELAKTFSSEEASSFINGVLDAVVKTLAETHPSKGPA